MRILVTGGAGYIGSHCVRVLVAAGHQVCVYDSLLYGHRAAVHPRAEFVHADLCDIERLRSVFSAGRFDAVMHFAALASVPESVADPLRYWRANLTHSLHLLECMKEAGVPRIVFSSTCAVYGEPQKLPIVEDLPKRPINPYGQTKLAVEQMLESSAAAWGLGAVALRYFNACGAAEDGSIGEDHTPETHLIPIVLQVALGQRQAVSVFGDDYPTPDGSCVRDYIHVDDLADVHRLAIERVRPGAFEAFNVGTGRGHSVLEVIAAARDVSGCDISLAKAPRRPGDPPSLYADAARIMRAYDWRPRHTDLHAIVQSAWNWHRGHPRGFRSEA
ncbi:UDP-glucose 4-epimerase [Phycisphaerae bacterium RAS1]|nr:UDP-glucose 4-epimerase [Phycisphaerae bacterium RAS1]